MKTESLPQQLKSNRPSLAEAWMKHHSAPLDYDAINQLADIIDHDVGRLISLNRFAGTPLSGHESAVRQDSVQLLVTGGFLKGNKMLEEASCMGWNERIEEELSRSVAAAIRYTRMRLRRSLIRYQRRFQPLPEDWPGTLGQKRYHLENAITAAAAEGKIRARDHRLLLAIVRDGQDPKRVAKDFGLSKSQTYRRIKAVSKQLRFILKEVL